MSYDFTVQGFFEMDEANFHYSLFHFYNFTVFKVIKCSLTAPENDNYD